MRHRTALKTGRTAAQQVYMLHTRAFIDYAAMVDRLAAGYLRPLTQRQALRVSGVSAVRNGLRVADRPSRA